MEMQQLIDNKEYAKFMDRYAEYKVENIHFRYKPPLRGVQEMNPTGRMLLGLIPFPRGVFNILVKNALEPIASRNPRKFWGGLKTLIKFMIGTSVADAISKKVTGRSSYDLIRLLFGYGPLSPGASTIVETFIAVSNVAYQGTEAGKNPAEIAASMAVAGASQLEIFIPLCEVLIDAYKAKNDIAHVNLYTLAKKAGMSKYEQMYDKTFKEKRRSTMDKLRLMIFESDPKDMKSDLEKLGEALTKRNTDVFGQEK